MVVATRWSERTADAVMRRLPVLDDRWDYKWGVVAKGMVSLWRATGDRRYIEYVKRSVDRFVGADGTIATYARDDFNIDFINPGKVLFPLYAETGDARYRAAALLLREQLRIHPRSASGSFWHKRIYPHQMWLDGVYMASPFLAEYAATFGEPELFDDVLRQIENAYEHTHDDRSGLLFHAFDESRAQPWADRETGRSRSFWGRAVGWYAMALADVLDIDRHARRRAKLVAIFRAVADAVARVQDPSGLWWQVLDQGGGGGNYLEESASAMFTYALAKGARQGHLPADHRRLAEKAHAAIVERFISTTNGDLDVTGCCVGTGLGGTPDRDGSFEYYAARPVATNDHHGVGAFLLASVEIERGTA